MNPFLFSVHNKYLLVWAETGSLGLMAYLAFLFGALRKGWQCWKLPDAALATLGLALTAGLARHMLPMTVEVSTGARWPSWHSLPPDCSRPCTAS